MDHMRAAGGKPPFRGRRLIPMYIVNSGNETVNCSHRETTSGEARRDGATVLRNVRESD